MAKVGNKNMNTIVQHHQKVASFLNGQVKKTLGKHHYHLLIKDRSEQGNDVDCYVDAFNLDDAMRILLSGQYGDWGEEMIKSNLAVVRPNGEEIKVIN